MHCFIPYIFFLLLPLPILAQSSVEEFALGGSARILDEDCIRLTPDQPFRSGSAWYEEAMDLRQPFELTVCLVFGRNDSLGADGISFVFHPTMQTGYRGEGMGFAGLIPSLGIEFDTYQNGHLADPVADHLAVNVNGQPHHFASIYGPVDLPDLEDGRKHLLWVRWNPAERELLIHLDGKERANLTIDLIGEVFAGNPRVFWGATAATGRKTNFHDICIKKLVFAAVER